MVGQDRNTGTSRIRSPDGIPDKRSQSFSTVNEDEVRHHVVASILPVLRLGTNDDIIFVVGVHEFIYLQDNYQIDIKFCLQTVINLNNRFQYGGVCNVLGASLWLWGIQHSRGIPWGNTCTGIS